MKRPKLRESDTEKTVVPVVTVQMRDAGVQTPREEVGDPMEAVGVGMESENKTPTPGDGAIADQAPL